MIIYYVGKLFQAAGLTVILIGFIKNFPDLMSHGVLGLGFLFFGMGWGINKFLGKR